MKIAIVTVTKKAENVAKRITEDLTCDLYFHNQNENTKQVIHNIFSKYDAIICIMACGIAVRSISEVLKSKKTDPAVIVIDEAGTNVISLISGHIGGGNELTKKIAKILNANPVITTASDVSKHFSIDMFAKNNNCAIENENYLTQISADIVNEKNVALYSDFPVEPKLLKRVNTISELSSYNSCVILSPYYYNVNVPLVYVRPKCLFVGVGCKKGVSFDEIFSFLKKCFNENNLSLYCIDSIATIDIKQNEIGIIRLAKSLNVDLKIIPKTDIKKIENQFEKSSFVSENIGVASVCEPCAYISSGMGEILVSKQKSNGITIAIAINWNFEENIYE